MSLVDEILAALEKGETEEETDVKPLPVEYEDDASGEVTKTRGYVKVQDGCNNFCSYCIIPYLRGRSRSRKMESVIREAEEMSEKTNEIVITGVDVSDYRDGDNGLAELVRALGKVPVRKRFGSFDCIVVGEKLLTAMKESDFCESFPSVDAKRQRRRSRAHEPSLHERGIFARLRSYPFDFSGRG